MSSERTRRVGRCWWLRSALLVVLTAAIVAPTAVWAADRFSDVPDGSVFHDDISWLADAGVTKGCNPPENDQFCPSAVVTREQMAAFMHRLAEAKVVEAADADTLDGMDSSAFLTGVESTYVRETTSLDSTASKVIEATCPAGYVASGGGAIALRNDGGDVSNLVVRGSTPTFTGTPQAPTGWIGFAEETASVTADWKLTVTVICIPTG